MSSEASDPHAGARVEDCAIRYERYEPGDEGRREVLLALGNGVFVVRGATVLAGDQAPHYPGTYRAGLYDHVHARLPPGEDETETLVRLPNWLPLELRFADGPWWRLEQLQILHYDHRLDLGRGCTVRDCTVRDARGRTTRLREHRLVSMARPHIASLLLEITPLDWSGCITLRSALEGDMRNTNVPAYADYPGEHLAQLQVAAEAAGEATLLARTRHGGVALAMAVGTRCEPAPERVQAFAHASGAGHLMELRAEAARTLVVEKTLALCTALDPDVADPLPAARERLAAAPPHRALALEQARAWAGLWERAGLDLQGAPAERPLKLHLFHLLQTISPHSVGLDCGVPARGWHGEGYHGHVFWDEAFVLRFLDFRFPEISRAALMYRWRRLDAARAAAQAVGLRGAMFPWRSGTDGRELTPRFQKNLASGGWMRDDTRLQRHVGAAIALGVWHHWLATGDLQFLRACGAELVLEIARFWSSLAQPRGDGERWQICGVVGPDEYHHAWPGRGHPGLDNNAYTNVMAVWTLERARELLDTLAPPDRERLRAQLHLDDAELARWDLLARRMFVPFHGEGVISQFEGFERLQPFDRSQLPAPLAEVRADWALHALGDSADAYQVTKQADVLTLFHLLSEDTVEGILHRLGYAFDRSALLRTAHYYLQRTTHRSSLSRVVYAGALARVAPELSWDLYRQALDTDLRELPGERVAEGIHLAAMAGTLDVLQRRYVGLAAEPGGLWLDPSLPPPLGTVRLALLFRGQRLEVQASGRGVWLRCAPENAAPVRVRHRRGCELLGPGQARAWPREG